MSRINGMIQMFWFQYYYDSMGGRPYSIIMTTAYEFSLSKLNIMIRVAKPAVICTDLN